MLYELAHFIKDRCSFFWDVVKWGNACVFSLQQKKVLQEVPQLLERLSDVTFTIRVTEKSDAIKLERFFAEQPKEEYDAMCSRVREVAKQFDYKVLAQKELAVIDSLYK